jgi:D-beta-D-heptose 7-phosphate kinase/D-beta-D-heptose 1-phosphate adenosyltransferase
MFDFEKSLALISAETVLCVGDLMLDEFVYGEVERISPEAPAPVLAVSRSELVIGGAGNVARNIAALGARCIFVGVVGSDDAGRRLTAELRSDPSIEARVVVDPSRITTRKVRFVSEHFSTHLLRADWEQAVAIEGETENTVLDCALAALPGAASVILSDYAKGMLTPRLLRALIDGANKLGKPVIVDPKGKDFSIYRGATLITPNRQELAGTSRHAVANEADMVAAAAAINREVGSAAVLVTRSEAGMSLVPAEGEPVHVAAYPVKVRDVSGAGDTVLAVLGAMLATGTGFEPAMRVANAAAAVAVGKRGTTTVSAAELRARILPAASLAPEQKILFDWTEVDEKVGEWRRQGLRIGFTNGCFDLLHPGHIKLLGKARSACDRLIIGLNGDASVSRLKGEGHPIQDVHARAAVLAALEAVDLVVVFDQNTPVDLIRRVRPKVLVKGSDYRHEQVVGRELVEADGGEVVLIDLVPGFSTSRIVSKARAPEAARSEDWQKEAITDRRHGQVIGTAST